REVERRGLGAWALGRITVRGLELRGFGHDRRVPWPAGEHGGVGSAVRRTVFDDRLRETAVEAGATVLGGVRVTAVEKGDDDEVAAVYAGNDRIACRSLVLADGVRSPVGKMLGRTCHRVHGGGALLYDLRP